jgi:hypothetical protein
MFANLLLSIIVKKKLIMTAPNTHVCLKYAQVKDIFLFATCEKLVVDMDGEVWHPEHYKGGMYFRKTASQYRVARKAR